MKAITLLALALFTSLFADAQSRDIGSNQYDLYEVGRMSNVDRGTVIACRTIEVGPGQTTGTWRNVGYGLGGAAGYAAAKGNDRYVYGAAAAVIVGQIADNMERKSQRQKGVEVIILMRDDRLVAITQGADQWFQEGQKVYILYGSRTKVIASRL